MKTPAVLCCLLLGCSGLSAAAEPRFDKAAFADERWATLEPIRKAVMAADTKSVAAGSLRLFLVFEIGDGQPPQAYLIKQIPAHELPAHIKETTTVADGQLQIDFAIARETKGAVEIEGTVSICEKRTPGADGIIEEIVTARAQGRFKRDVLRLIGSGGGGGNGLDGGTKSFVVLWN